LRLSLTDKFPLQLAQDDDDFEIRSLANSLDEEGALPLEDYDYERHSIERELSPVPPKPVQPAPQQRESLDGETIFAVGEEDGDKFSDDEDEDDDFRKSSEERRKLTGGPSL
jgi:hypothetical protein